MSSLTPSQHNSNGNGECPTAAERQAAADGAAGYLDFEDRYSSSSEPAPSTPEAAEGARSAAVVREVMFEAKVDIEQENCRVRRIAHERDQAAAAALDYTSVRDRLVRGGTFVLDVPEVPDTIWGSGDQVLWPEGESLMIAGQMGTGKTSLAGLLVRAMLGLGDGAVLGLPVRPMRRVQYLAMDRPPQIARAFARQFEASDRDVLDERLVVWPGPPPGDLARNTDLLTDLANEAGADAVVVDGLKDGAIGLSEDEVGAGWNRARQALLVDGRQLLELHHTTKRNASGGPPRDVADIYGSTWLTAGSGSVLLINGEPGDPIVECRHVKQPMAEVGPWQLLHDQATGSITVHHATDLVSLAAACGPDGLTAHAAAVALSGTDKPSRAQVEKARYRLDKKTDEGLLTRLDGAKGGGEKTKAPSTWFLANQAVAL